MHFGSSLAALAFALPLMVARTAWGGPDPLARPPGARTSTARPANHLYARLSSVELAASLARAHRRARDLPSRLERVTRGLLGAPYLLSPLGEGRGSKPDPDPRFRLDAFDCTTFVETAIALSRNERLADAAELLDRLRYSELPALFTKRRHLIEAQWVPGLIGGGFVRDITREVGGDRVRTMAIELDTLSWKKRRVGRSIALEPSDVPHGRFELPYIPIEVMVREKIAIPPGTIIDIVREHVPWSPTMTAHQGLVLAPPKGGPLFVRHASPVAKRVIDEPLARMMARYLHPRTPKKWRVAGVHLLAIVEPAATTTAERR